MSRKNRSTKKSRVINLKAIHSDPVRPLSLIKSDSLDLSHTDSDFSLPIAKANTLPSLKTVNTTNHEQLFDDQKPLGRSHLSRTLGRNLNKYSTAPLPRLHLDLTPKNLFNTALDGNNFFDLKTHPMSTSHLTSSNVLNKFSPINTLGTSFNPNELNDSLNDSLHRSLNNPEPSPLRFAKSQGRFKLPSISSTDSHIGKLSHVDTLGTIIRSKTFTGRRYKKASEEETQQIQATLGNNKLHDSIDDSLRAYSMTSNNGAQFYDLPNNNADSNNHTIDSKYLKSFDEVPGSADYVTRGESSRGGNREHNRSKNVDRQNDSLVSHSESLNARGSLHDSSARTLLTVCSHDDNSRMALSKNFMTQSNRMGVMVDNEYTGDIRRLCLLGSGSEAKVMYSYL